MNWVELTTILSRPIAFHRIFVTIGGGACAGLFLSQAFYWTDRTKDPDGWFYKTQAEWEEETGLTRYEQETVRKQLVKRGLLETKKEGIPCKLYYRIVTEAFLEAIQEAQAARTLTQSQFGENQQTSLKTLESSNGQYGEKPQTGMGKNHKLDRGFSTNNLYTETTNRDYTETTVVVAAAKIPTAEVEVLEPESPEEEQNTETLPSDQQCSDLATTREVAHEEESSAAPDAEILKQVERVAHNWRLRPWRVSAQHFKPEMIRAVWQCNPGYYSLQGTQTPNQHHILKTLQLLERQLKSLDAAAVNAYHELMRYWQTAEVLANPQVQDAFVAVAAQSKERQKQAEWKTRAKEMQKALEDL